MPEKQANSNKIKKLIGLEMLKNFIKKKKLGGFPLFKAGIEANESNELIDMDLYLLTERSVFKAQKGEKISFFFLYLPIVS